MSHALRPARDGDAAAIAALYAPYVLAGSVSFETEAPDAAAMSARMHAGGGLYPWIVATGGQPGDAGENVLGFAYASPFRDREAYRYTTETTIYLAKEARGRGIGPLLYAALIDTLLAQNFAQAIAAISYPNDRSVALHRAAGFKCAGVMPAAGYKEDRWIDVAFWQRPLSAWSGPAPALKRFADIGIVRA